MGDWLIKRPLFFACSLAVLCCCICSFLDAVGMITLCGVMLFAFLLLLPFKSKFIYPSLIAVILCFAMVAVNMVNYFTCYLSARSYAKTTAVVTGDVTEMTDEMIYIDCKTVTVDGKREKVGFKAGFSYTECEKLLPSAKVTLNVEFYDDVYRSEIRKESIYGYAAEIAVDKKYAPASLRYMIYSSRSAVAEAMPFDNEDTAAFMKAIILGVKDDVSGVFLNKFNTVGLSHFMALSGLHLIFAVALVDFILSLLGVNYRARAVIALISIFVFTFLSGFTVSCVRAAVMMAVFYVARVFGKVSDSLTSLSVSCFVIVLFTPYNICSLSFLLSSSATFGIISLYPCFNKIFKINIKNTFVGAVVRSVLRVFYMSLSATLMCLPILAVVFRRVCVISPLVSVAVSYPLQLLFCVGALGTVLSFVPYIGVAFSFIADILYSIVEFVVDKCYYIENITVGLGYKLFYFVLALLAVLVVGIYIFYKTKKSSRVTLLYIGGYALLCVILFAVNTVSMRGKVNVHFADVGQGNATVIAYREHATLVDCGGDNINGLKNVFTDNSIKHIDLIALTHMDGDHMRFLDSIIDTYPVDEIAVPFFSDVTEIQGTLDRARQNGVKITVIKQDGELDLYCGSKLYCYVENSEKVQYIDNLSAVYRFEMGDRSALLTGDISIHQEYYFLDYTDDFDVDVLLVAHHGSNTSTHQLFVDLCSPEYSVISVGKNNPYGHPNSKVVKRLEQSSKLLMTSERSTISFQFTSKGYKCLNEY